MRILVYSFLLIFLVTFYTVAPSGMSKGVITALLLTVLLSLLLFIFKRESNPSLKGQYLKHSTLALVGITIVFFQFPLDYVLGNESASNMYIWVNNSIVIKSITLSVIGLISFLLGYLFFMRRGEIKRRIPAKDTVSGVNFLVVLAASSLILFFVTVNPLYLVGSYFGIVEMGQTASHAILFFRLLMIAAVIQKTRNMILTEDIPVSFKGYLKKIGWPLSTLACIYFVAFILSGDRGELIILALLFFSGYFMVTKKKLALRYLVLFVVLGAFTLTLLGIARTYRGLSFGEKITKSLTSTDSRRESSIVPATAELSWSIKTLNTAVDYVPSNHDFFYGRFQIQQIFRIAPFFSVFYPIIFGPEELIHFTSGSQNRFASSGTYITWIRQGNYPYTGVGSSCMADLYLDFGLLGVIIGMFYFGYFMRYSEINMLGGNLPLLFVHIFAVVYFCNVIFTARGTLLADLRTVVWIYLILLLNRYFFQRLFVGRS